jgi:hypothetical protein
MRFMTSVESVSVGVFRVAVLLLGGLALASPALAGGCPEPVIEGTIGSGSSDHPFTTGLQTSRLFRNSVESTCGTAKPSPGLTDAGTTFKYDAYSFFNDAFTPRCFTVISTAGGVNQLLTAAYRGTFNPANVEQNYLGDAGNSDRTRAFSFLVPARQSFVVVQSRVNNAGNPTSLDYSFRVLGFLGCTSCAPQIIVGSIPDGSAQWPASVDTQSGRLFRNNALPTCDTVKPVPSVEDPAVQFQYNAYTFLNPAATPACVTVNTTAGASNQLLTSAYLDRFNPFDVQENYLGDAGNSNQSRSFSFLVPGRRSFVVLQSRVNTAANPTSLDYFFSVEGLPGCTGCPAITVGPGDVPDGFEDLAYSVQLTSDGGADPGTWSLGNGELPAGLDLTPSGLLSGTPLEVGNFRFSSRFTDDDLCLGEKAYFFSIAEPLPFLDGFESGDFTKWIAVP